MENLKNSAHTVTRDRDQIGEPGAERQQCYPLCHHAMQKSWDKPKMGLHATGNGWRLTCSPIMQLLKDLQSYPTGGFTHAVDYFPKPCSPITYIYSQILELNQLTQQVLAVNMQMICNHHGLCCKVA